MKIIALLSVVRWYNILLTVIAQYISAFVIMRPESRTLHMLLTDLNLHGIVIASVFSIAAGFIINNFYDYEKDMINRPRATLFNKYISGRSTLNFYILFNCISLLVGFLASFRIGLFFSCFIISLWIYSHKLQRLPFIKELAASILSVTCFFAVLLHYSRYSNFIFIYGAFYMSLVYSRELVKQFMNYTGDLALNIQSLPVSLGIEKARSFLAFVMLLSMLGGLGILFQSGMSSSKIFILICVLCGAVSMFLLQRSKYKEINTLYKILLILGILNLIWI